MRTTPHALGAFVVAGALALSACGGNDDSNSTEAPTTTVETTVPDTDDSATDDTVADPNAVCSTKPEVQTPDEIPEELVVTVLIPGTGPEAQDGDTLIVDYVGVRSEDGEEFDNSYDRGQPFTVNLGAGGVIEGWQQGLANVQTGSRLQLDIPADLAYGDQGAGQIIQPGDALTFVIDVCAVIGPSDPDDAPDVELTPSEGATEVTTEDLIVGEGTTIAEGNTAYVQLIAYRGDNLEVLDNTWLTGNPVQLVVNEADLIPGLFEGLLGMQAGGRRVITIPDDDAWGPEGNEGLGLPPETDLILVIDLVAAF